MLVADVTEAEIAAHLAGETVDIAAVTVAAPGSAAEEDALLALADTVNTTKIAADLQGTSNAKATIFTLGAQLAAAHPNVADAQKASAAALGVQAEVAAAVPAVEDVCLIAVRQTQQSSDNNDGTVVLDEQTGVDDCVAAQAALA